MLKYLETTTLILAWLVVFATLWTVVCFIMSARAKTIRKDNPGSKVIFPALLLSPLAVRFGFEWLGVNFIYPIHLLSTFLTIVWHGILPAFILLVASGLAQNIHGNVAREMKFWNEKAFMRTRKAFGLSLVFGLRRLVIGKSLFEGFASCLPWVFGELIIVEAVFNGPGLGLAAWSAAKSRDLTNLTSNMLTLGLIYLFFVMIVSTMNARIGRRLESYV